ncbi:g6059 [Coccomyxa viridis]|uniref:G6059 protein n=1 Tax=Coccomyxa viridis TaxID=1274662 RepID=A0ABP1G123_9CHLO
MSHNAHIGRVEVRRHLGATVLKESMAKDDGPETLGHPLDHGKYNVSFNKARQFIFIRHGEKPPKDENGKETSDDLSQQGYFRAANLHQVFGKGSTPSGYNTPDVIYAMKSQPKSDASNRPFETVEPLAVALGMKPTEDQRTQEAPGVNVFDNCFEVDQHTELKHDVIERCESGEYEEKTIMFCWEHKNIPYIVAKFGFAKKDLTWGLNPKRGKDEHKNFTAIWVFTPTNAGLDFKVYSEFEIGSEGNSGDGPFTVQTPPDGYGKEVYSHVDTDLRT